MPHRTKAVGKKISKLRKEGFTQRVAVGRAFGILKGKHKKHGIRKK